MPLPLGECEIHGNSLDEIVPKVNLEMKKICDWFRKNELNIHPEKTKFMIFNKLKYFNSFLIYKKITRYSLIFFKKKLFI